MLQEQHAAELSKLANENREHLRRWMTWIPDHYSVEDARRQIKQSLARYVERNGFWSGIWHRGELAGCLVYNYIDWKHRSTEISYFLGAEFEGKGLITKACRAAVNYAFNDQGLHRIEIRCASENLRSRAVPERLGFRTEGTLLKANWLHTRYVDVVVYGLLVDEWE